MGQGSSGVGAREAVPAETAQIGTQEAVSAAAVEPAQEAASTAAAQIVARMTLEEKASLGSGFDVWHTKAVERLGVPSFMVADGPHGLRKQSDEFDHLGLHKSLPATCFPTSSTTACSFDRALMREIGAAIGEECQHEQVSVVLGPGVNIKRSPLCGRNFEYISEDPYATGQMAAALIEGVQSKGVGTSLKHFALNNQETCRMVADSVVDERAKREIYLTGFETAVKQAQPWTVMSSYNRIDGIYASDNKHLLTDILRDEWGFKGAVVTDWGGMSDRVEAVKAGSDLEMPADGGYHDADVVQAVRDGILDEADVDKVATRMVELALRCESSAQGGDFDIEAHNALARKAAAESCVLLKNDGDVLPLQPSARIAVIGRLAKEPRFQGSGSSRINAFRIQSVADALEEAGIAFDYADGYCLKRFALLDDALIEEACSAARGKDAVLLFAGLPAEYESEGFDRRTLAMPEAHNRLIEAVSQVNPNIVVVLQLGAPVEMPWKDKAEAIVVSYLGGQAGGGGCVDVLFNKVCPSGHLAETWPHALADTSSSRYFPGNLKSVEYRESIFVGYRYYDTAHIPVAWPFGHGLSYTAFEYSALDLTSDAFASGGKLTVRFTVKNIGDCAGAAVPQLYIGMRDSVLFRAAKELKGFDKIFLEAGESATVSFDLDDRSFAYYNAPSACWAIEEGIYVLSIGESSTDMRLSADIAVKGDGRESALVALRQEAPEYYDLAGSRAMQPDGSMDGLVISDESFTALLGRSLPHGTHVPGEPFTIDSTLQDAQSTLAGRFISMAARRLMVKMLDGEEATMEIGHAMFLETPLRALGLFSGGAVSPYQVDGIVDILNGRFFRGLAKFLRKQKQ